MADEKKEAAPEAAPPEEKKKKSPIILVVVLVLIGPHRSLAGRRHLFLHYDEDDGGYCYRDRCLGASRYREIREAR